MLPVEVEAADESQHRGRLLLCGSPLWGFDRPSIRVIRSFQAAGLFNTAVNILLRHVDDPRDTYAVQSRVGPAVDIDGETLRADVFAGIL